MRLDTIVENHPDASVFRLMAIAAPYVEYSADELRREIIARVVNK